MAGDSPDWLEEARSSGLTRTEAATEELVEALRAQSDLFVESLQQIAELVGRLAE